MRSLKLSPEPSAELAVLIKQYLPKQLMRHVVVNPLSLSFNCFKITFDAVPIKAKESRLAVEARDNGLIG